MVHTATALAAAAMLFSVTPASSQVMLSVAQTEAIRKSPAPTPNDVVRDNTFAFQMIGSRLTGPGIDHLIRAADGAQFVVLGE